LALRGATGYDRRRQVSGGVMAKENKGKKCVKNDIFDNGSLKKDSIIHDAFPFGFRRNPALSVLYPTFV